VSDIIGLLALTYVWLMAVSILFALDHYGIYREPKSGELRIKYFMLQLFLIVVGPVYLSTLGIYKPYKYLFGRFDR
jgi:hypothetical protein